VFEGVERCPKAKVRGYLETPRLAGDEAVTAYSVFAGVDPGDVGWIAKHQVVHVNTVASGQEEG
jgi:hypothetical protein